VRRLIINADDFGLTAGVNRAILEAHEHGVVTSATLMANGQAFEDAIALAQSRPGLGVGCHVVLVDGASLLDETAVRSLLDRGGNRSGHARFREGITRFGALALLGRLAEQAPNFKSNTAVVLLTAQGTIVVGVLAVQTETAIGARLPPPRMTPDEVVSDALDAVQAGKNEEVVAGSLTQGAYQAFTADPKAFQAKMSMRLPQPS